jgi:hypothetical protein
MLNNQRVKLPNSFHLLLDATCFSDGSIHGHACCQQAHGDFGEIGVRLGGCFMRKAWGNVLSHCTCFIFFRFT